MSPCPVGGTCPDTCDRTQPGCEQIWGPDADHLEALRRNHEAATSNDQPAADTSYQPLTKERANAEIELMADSLDAWFPGLGDIFRGAWRDLAPLLDFIEETVPAQSESREQ